MTCPVKVPHTNIWPSAMGCNTALLRVHSFFVWTELSDRTVRQNSQHIHVWTSFYSFTGYRQCTWKTLYLTFSLFHENQINCFKNSCFIWLVCLFMWTQTVGVGINLTLFHHPKVSGKHNIRHKKQIRGSLDKKLYMKIIIQVFLIH